MRKTLLHTFSSPYREDFHMYAYDFNGITGRTGNEKNCAIVGALRGNDIEQLFASALIIKKLKEFEEKGLIAPGKRVTVVPCANHYAMNSGKKFCTKCNKDVNRCFPGLANRENVDRLAYSLFDKVSGYENGIQIAADFNANGSFITHAISLENQPRRERIQHFYLPYFFRKNDERLNDNTLISSWINDGTAAFSIFTNEATELDVDAASVVMYAVLNFLLNTGVLLPEAAEGGHGFTDEIELLRVRRGADTSAEEFSEDRLTRVSAPTGGLYQRMRNYGEHVKKGDLLARILHPYEGYSLTDITAPEDGLLFFMCRRPVVIEKATVFMMIRE